MSFVATCKRKTYVARIGCILAFLFIISSVYAQKISVQFKSTSLIEAFKDVERKTTYRFSYATEALTDTHPVTLALTNEPIETVLQKLFEDQPLSYSIDQHFILVRPKVQQKNSLLLSAEKGRLSGRVINEKGEGIAAASVQVKNSTVGTTTDEQGFFRLDEVEENAVLVVSSVGYAAKEAWVKGVTSLVIRLVYSVGKLDETVVIAYGTTTRRINTGTVSKVSGEDISKQPVSNPLAALEGRATGLFITQTNGLPGSNFKVQIRGQNSIQQGNEPLYIIDGVPYPSQSFSQVGGTNANSPLQLINPLLIQSVEILKDGDATAIYGSRGANGVILITTKSSNTDKTTVEISGYTGWSRALYHMQLMTSAQYIAMRREAFSNDGVVPTSATAYDLLNWDSTRYTDWKKILIGRTGITSNIASRVSGGSTLTHFTFGANYAKERTVFPGDFGNHRATVDLGMNHKSPNNKFQFILNSSFGYDQNDLLPGDLTASILLPPTMYSPFDSAGRLVWREGGFTSGNPLANTLKKYIAKTERLTARTLLSYSIVPKLQVKTSIGYNSFSLSEATSTPIVAQDPANNPKGSASFGRNSSKSWIVEPTVEYSHLNIGRTGSLQLLIGASIQQTSSESTRTSGSGYTNDALLNTIAGASTTTFSDGNSLYRYEALFARVNYNLNQKYYLNITGRRDGSSRFSPSKRAANFGAVGGAWIFGKEAWIVNHLKGISYGKLRGSYGVTGSDQVGEYKYLDAFTATTYPFGSTPALRPTQLFNNAYGWEQIRKLELALEIGILQDRFLFNINFYRNRSDNQFIATTLPTQTGFSSITQSFPGKVQNKGLEIDINSVNLNTEVKWKSNVNFTSSSNQLVSFPGLANSAYATRYIIGKPVTALLGYHFLGIDPTTGVYQFEDTNKDGIINNSDYIYNGSVNPSFFGGIGNNVSYKGWSLEIFFQFVKQKGIDPIYSSIIRPGAISNMPLVLEDRWKQANDNVLYQKVSVTAGKPAYTAAGLVFNSSARLADASYVRLKSLELAYSLAPSALEKVRSSGARLFVQGTNLWTYTRFRGADPETQSTTTLPPLRTITVGAQIKF